MSKKNPIPVSFECMGTTFNVHRYPELIKLSNCMGQTRHNENEVLVDASLTGDQLWHTYYHEIVHVILGSLGRNDLNGDEAFVDAFAGLLYQIQKTSEFE
jgi:hypothetical protein